MRVLAQEIEVELVEWTEGAEERGLGAGFGELPARESNS